ncbi:MAG: S8 family serine peptidase [Pseudobdellovibrionaceae bacterium]|nr:S8 family serine peptidase [Pseudobdellovibrionaceae bacterium]
MRRMLAAWTTLLGVAVSGVTFAEARLIDFEKPHRSQRYIVRLKDNAIAARSLFRAAGVTPVHSFESIPAFIVETDRDTQAAALEALRQNPDVAYIQANRIFKISKTPNDPSYGSQYHHKNIASNTAWEVSTGSKDVVVAVIDTGVNYNHPDLAPNYWTNPGESGADASGKDKRSNGVDDDRNGYIDDFRGWNFVKDTNDPMDDHGHGTHCAGVIGAKGNNGMSVVGVNWDVSIVGLKFIDGKTGEGDTEGALKAIEYANKMGIPITSNSWGGQVDKTYDPNEPDALKELIAAAGEQGFLFIAAAGNDGSNNDKTATLPASYNLDNIISVAATGTSDSLAFYSSYGPTTVDIAAPGTNVLSTWLSNRTQKMSGTSMAAPVVAGAAALLKATHPNWTAREIKDRLLETVDPVSSLKTRVLSGGRLNVGRAIAD